MGRLIDADACPCILCEDTRNAHCTYEHRSCEKFCNWLNNTAYDMEKVVADLKGFMDEAEQFGVSGMVSDMIEVVRNGGVES